jgi:outer membrane protein assembly factor BamB
VRVRRIVAVVVAVVCAVAAGLIAWRVLAPAEVSHTATAPWPAVPDRAPGVTGRTAQAPLVVDGRIRVFAAKRQVRADAPVDAKTAYTARWSYRRWPQQLNGVVAAGATVVSRWSDGRLVALDGGTGRVAWRADGPPAGGYAGHRTGAATVWAPDGLHVSGTTVLVRGDGRIAAHDAGTGTRRWAADCSGPSFTTAGGQAVCAATAYRVATGQPAPGWGPGPFAPLGCDVAGAGCRGARDAAGAGWLTVGDRPVRARALDIPGTTVVTVARTTATGPATSAFAVAAEAGAVVARSPLTGAELWRHPAADATVLGSGPDAIHVLTDRALRTLDPSTGEERASFRPAVGTEKTDWIPGLWQVADGYVAIERLTNPDPEAHDHYFTVETVLIAAIG